MTEKKVAVITAAGSGMGAACVRRLHADGFEVAVLSSSGKGEALAQELGGVGVTGSNLNADDLQRVVDAAMERWERIDVLVNSAGHGPKGPLLDITDDEWHHAMDVFLLNVVRLARMVTPIMEAQRKGSIVNISTAWVEEPTPIFPTSGVVRAGLAAFAKMYADIYAPKGIRMNTVLPGWIDSRPATEERRVTVPMQRYGTAEEVAGAVAFLASDDASYMTGQNVRVDGGLMRSL